MSKPTPADQCHRCGNSYTAHVFDRNRRRCPSGQVLMGGVVVYLTLPESPAFKAIASTERLSLHDHGSLRHQHHVMRAHPHHIHPQPTNPEGTR